MPAKFTFIFSLLILLPVFTQAQISTNQEKISIDSAGVTPDTLVAYYPFTGDAADSSGFENDGEVFGAQLTEDRFGNANSAYRFDGDDYIDFGSSDSIEFGKNDFSFSLWIKPKNEERSQYQILRKGNDHATFDEARWAIELVEDGRLRLIFEDAENGSNTLVTFGENNFLYQKWHHVVAVFDRDSSLRVYVNNELELEDERITNYSGHITNVSSYNLYAGRDNTGNPAKGFSGSMDDIRIYSHVLHEGAIDSLYSENDWPSSEFIPDTLVAYYPFTGNAADSSGFGNDGEVFGAQSTQDRFGNANSAYRFDGFDDFIEIDQNRAQKIIGDLSISLWVKPSSFNSNTNGIVTFQGNNSDNSDSRNALYKLNFLPDKKLRYAHEGSGGDDEIHDFGNDNLTENNWTNIVVVRDTTEKRLRVYIDGDLMDSSLYESQPTGGDLSYLTIGQNHGTVNPSRFFDGIIDDLRIYNYQLDDSTIYNLYAQGDWPLVQSLDSTGIASDTLIAHYQFNGNAADSSGFGNDGEVFGAALAADRFGNLNQAYVFDGDDYINFGSSDSIEFGKNDFSFSLWIRPVNQGRSQYQILRKGNDHRTLNEARWAIELVEDGRLRVIFEDAESEFNTLIATGEQELLDEKWHHIAGVFDRDSSLRVFVDNQLDLESQAIRNYSGHITNVTSYNLYAGRDNTGNPAKGFSGSMDDIRIYSYALGEGAIKQLYEGDDNVVVSNRPEDKISLPSYFKLYQNYPNPFNPTTQIKYDLKEPGFVELNVYDITGRRVAQLVNKRQLQGSYTLTYNASNLASGIYFYELKSGPVRITKKFTLIK